MDYGESGGQGLVTTDDGRWTMALGMEKKHKDAKDAKRREIIGNGGRTMDGGCQARVKAQMERAST